MLRIPGSLLKLACAGLIAIAPAAFALEFSFPENSFAFGKAAPMVIKGLDCGEFLRTVDSDFSADGSLSLELELDFNPGIGPVPFVPPEGGVDYDLRWNFTLQPGAYTLSLSFEEQQETLTFTVRDSVFEIVPALSGSWYNPEQSGKGWNIEVLGDSRLIAYWYSYDDDGDNVWLVADGNFAGASASLNVMQAEGFGFPPDYDPDTHTLAP
jgi:hypothetical protein